MTLSLTTPTVPTPTTAATAVPPLVDAAARPYVRAWLATVALLVLAIVVVGGATRLTDSGLSITEWQPILGVIPPLTAADWQTALEKYRQIPQYQSLNKGMSLEAFQVIYYWEWGHRVLGRLIGLALAVPLLVFWLRGALSRRLALRIFAIGLLVGLQGAIGWYMVASGLADRIYVSQYRLALHLSMAFLILAALVWVILDLAPSRAAARPRPTPTPGWAGTLTWAWVLAGLTFSQVAIGGFVAGLKAGRAYNTWPLMDGQVIPDGLWRMEPWWINLGENMTTVQFNHRLTAYVLVGLAVWHAVHLRRAAARGALAHGPAVRSAQVLAAGLLVQMAIGIWTVVAAVPIGLGILHQGFAAVVFAVAVWHVHAVRAEDVAPTAVQPMRPMM
jgi:cytochrome c oxidase assembly protein subunit 15